jgi:type II secretory pathway pseudopilin PulG
MITKIKFRRQRGAALLIMIVFMVVGIAAVLITSLSTAALKHTRQEKTLVALNQAKEALIGRAVSDSNRPGELPCPDINGDGQLTLNVDFSGGSPPTCIAMVGYLPWKTLGLSELRDGDNSKLWYALSQNFYAGNTAILNSDTPGQLSTSGAQSQSNIVAIIFAPGAPLCGQTRNANSIDQYLEAVSSVTATTAVISAESNDCSASPFNDQFLVIDANDILRPTEMRIAREARACLDNYASSSGQKYPWAEPVTNPTGGGQISTFFGRISVTPNISTSVLPPTPPALLNLQSSVSNLQNAVNACINSANSSNTSDLKDISGSIRSALFGQTASPYSNVLNAAISASPSPIGTATYPCNYIRNQPNNNPIVESVSNAVNAVATAVAGTSSTSSADASMSTAWPAACIVNQPYWTDWRNLVFYQVVNGFQPGGTTLNCGGACLSINGNGAYRAAVLIARNAVGAQTRSSNVSDISNLANYLEGINVHDSAGTSTAFETHLMSTTQYSIVNDLVLCLDGQVNCR